MEFKSFRKYYLVNGEYIFLAWVYRKYLTMTEQCFIEDRRDYSAPEIFSGDDHSSYSLLDRVEGVLSDAASHFGWACEYGRLICFQS